MLERVVDIWKALHSCVYGARDVESFWMRLYR